MAKPPEFDVIVIGAGAGGAPSAWRLATSGLSVLLLDAGPAFGPADYGLDRPGWEEISSPVKPGSQGVYSFGHMNALPPEYDHLRSRSGRSGQYFQGGRRRGISYQHVRGIGGSTLHFSGEAHRLRPESMQMRSLYGVGADWPLSYAELEPYYALAETQSGVAGQADPARPRHTAYPLPPHPPSYASQVLIRRTRDLGLEWLPNPLAVLSHPHDGRPACNYCGQCNRGCPRRDKGSVDVTYVPRAVATGRCRVIPRATVTRLVAGADDRIDEVTYADAAGTRFSIPARIVVLAAGAIETPRLLLNSRDKYAAEGVANEHGQVGRHFMETLAWDAAATLPEPLGSFRGLPSDIICWNYNAPDALPGIPGGFRIVPDTTSMKLGGPIAYAQRVVDGWGLEHKRGMRETFGRALALSAMGESLPNDKTYVDLDPERQDEAGNPIARIHSSLSELDFRRLDRMARVCRDIFAALGADAPFEEFSAFDMFAAAQVFGTARMGTDPLTAVVDRFGRSHRWNNLFIADASVFPSIGGGEAPSLTIQALALRTADAIRERAARREL